MVEEKQEGSSTPDNNPTQTPKQKPVVKFENTKEDQAANLSPREKEMQGIDPRTDEEKRHQARGLTSAQESEIKSRRDKLLRDKAKFRKDEADGAYENPETKSKRIQQEFVDEERRINLLTDAYRKTNSTEQYIDAQKRELGDRKVEQPPHVVEKNVENNQVQA